MRALHQVIHFNPAKMANDSAHMNTHAGTRVCNVITNAGKTRSGSVSIQMLPCPAVGGGVETEINVVPGAMPSNNRLLK